MPRSRGFQTRPIRSNRRKTGWFEGPFHDISSLVSAGSTVWLTGQTATDDGLTLVRLRGEACLSLRLATAVGDGFDGFAMGICIVTGNAAGVGITAIPKPLTDIDWDGWIWHQLGGHITGLETTEVQRGFHALRIPIDSKAMRKFKASDVIVGVVQMDT